MGKHRYWLPKLGKHSFPDCSSVPSVFAVTSNQPRTFRLFHVRGKYRAVCPSPSFEGRSSNPPKNNCLPLPEQLWRTPKSLSTLQARVSSLSPCFSHHNVQWSGPTHLASREEVPTPLPKGEKRELSISFKGNFLYQICF